MGVITGGAMLVTGAVTAAVSSAFWSGFHEEARTPEERAWRSVTSIGPAATLSGAGIVAMHKAGAGGLAKGIGTAAALGSLAGAWLAGNELPSPFPDTPLPWPL